MRRELTPAQRLVVAADYKPPAEIEGRRNYVEKQVLTLADSVAGLGIVFKVNSALRALGYDLIKALHDRGLLVFVDLKIFDIKDTLEIDGMLLREFRLDLLTTVCFAGDVAMAALKATLPETEILGVTWLTSLTDGDAQAMLSCSTEEAVLRLAKFAKAAGIGGLISSPAEVDMLRANFGLLLSLNTPAIRPVWSIVESDGQNLARVMTPAKAIKVGADRLVIGRPITQAKNPREAVLRTLDEIEEAIALTA